MVYKGCGGVLGDSVLEKLSYCNVLEMLLIIIRAEIKG